MATLFDLRRADRLDGRSGCDPHGLVRIVLGFLQGRKGLGCQVAQTAEGFSGRPPRLGQWRVEAGNQHRQRFRRHVRGGRMNLV